MKRKADGMIAALLFPLLCAAVLVVMYSTGGMRSSFLLDLETVIFGVLLVVNIPLSVVSLVMTVKKRFSKKVTGWVVALSIINILISLVLWAVVLLIFGVFALTWVQN